MAAGARLKLTQPEGIRFQCQQTGQCCVSHGEYAYVYLGRADESRLAAHLGITLGAFRHQHTEKVAGRRVLRSREGGCVFLEGKRCGVHPARPSQCAAWPFWRDNLDPEVWTGEIAPFCAGVGKGRLHTWDEIEAMAKRFDDLG